MRMGGLHLKGGRASRKNRDKSDLYSTPDDVTDYLLDRVVFSEKVLEPACGQGYLSRRLKARGKKVASYDIEAGSDFLLRTARWPYDMITNPPYHDDMPLRFAQKALELVDGQVCMLLPGGFLWTDTRAEWFDEGNKPSLVIVVPWRIRFIKRDGRPIAGQFYSNAWFVWPERALRPRYADPVIMLGKTSDRPFSRAD